MEKILRRYHEVIIDGDPEQRRRVAMEQNGQFYVMLIESDRHGAESFEREQLRFVEEFEE